MPLRTCHCVKNAEIRPFQVPRCSLSITELLPGQFFDGLHVTPQWWRSTKVSFQRKESVFCPAQDTLCDLACNSHTVLDTSSLHMKTTLATRVKTLNPTFLIQEDSTPIIRPQIKPGSTIPTAGTLRVQYGYEITRNYKTI